MEKTPKEAQSVKAKIMEAALTFFLAVFLIYIGVRLLLEVWWVLILLAAVVMAAIISYRVWRSRRRW